MPRKARIKLKDFCAFILSHNRAGKVITYTSLRASGYTGKIRVIVDDGDPELEEYKKEFGEELLVFSKDEIAETFDEGDNFGDRRSAVYARNTVIGFAKEMGAKAFVQLDDDYKNFSYRLGPDREYAYTPMKNLDKLFVEMSNYLVDTQIYSIALSQGGDHIGGAGVDFRPKRKAMNSFVCLTDRPFQFIGGINEDVNTYVALSLRGKVFLTVMWAQLVQIQTQTATGGATELYLSRGTYIKSFYSVMYCPSGVSIGVIRDVRSEGRDKEGCVATRIHHRVAWNNVAPKILPETLKKKK